MTSLAVAGLSARLMAEAAASDGFEVVALDLFGDVDTCAAASRWFGIGEAATLRIDDDRLLAALAALARHGEVAGWVAGSGFEGRPDLLARGAALLPLIGTEPDAVARLRNPARFFAFLAEHDIEHPPVRLAPCADGSAWLLKDAGGCGVWHIRRAEPGAPLAAGHYLQREVAGQPMSATFVANGTEARLLGINQQIVCPFGDRPHVFCGVLGPVPVAEGVLRRLDGILRTLSAGFALRGLASLDFLLDAGRVLVLEVNPRPPASLASYPQWRPMAAHLRACRHGELPAPPQASAAEPVRGHQIVFARQSLRLGQTLAQSLANRPDTHDLPSAGQRFAAGDPLCSVSAAGASAAEVLGRLNERREALLHSLESCS